MSAEELKTCEVCGATIYPEHIKKGVADFLAGRLLCPHCLREKRQIAAVSPGAIFAKDDEQEDSPTGDVISLAEEEEAEAASRARAPKITAFGGGPEGGVSGSGIMPAVTDAGLRRPLLHHTQNATRCRTFHCKLTDAAMAHMNEVINRWADANDEIEIKFATSCIGTIEAKSHSDLHLIVTVFY